MEPEVTTEEIVQSAVELVTQSRAEEAVALPPVMAEIQGPAQEIETMLETDYSTPRPEGLPEPEPGEIIMTRPELGRSRKPWIKEAKFRVYTQANRSDGLQEGWWGQGFSGYRTTREEGGLESYEKVMTLNTYSAYWLYVVDPTLKVEEKPSDPRGKRRCNMAAFLGTTIVAMMKLSPKNETFRAKLMAIIGEMPPKDCDTFEKIKDWVEFNFPKTKENVMKEALSLRVTFTESERGRCRYTKTRTAISHIKITDKDFEDALNEAGDDSEFDDVASFLSNIIEGKARENANDYQNESTETSDEDGSEVDTEDFDYGYSTVKSHLREYIRKNYPDQADGMGLA